MIKFVKQFICGWVNYPDFKAFQKRFTPEELKIMENNDAKRGIKPIKGRFDYALRCAKRW